MNETIKLRCLFCFGTNFELPSENYQPKHGEQIRCSNCGHTNDYDSLMRIAERKAKEIAQEKINEQ